MEQTEQVILEPLLIEASVKRRQLLPIWMKVFCWFFLFTGVVAPLAVLVGILFNVQASMALYGLETTAPLSVAGLLISALFLLKGVVAYGLWWEKDWAITWGLADAIAGIAVCGFIMIVLPFMEGISRGGVSLRLELVALIPYLIKLRNIKPLWERGHSH